MRLNELHLSENKYHGNVKKFVVTERDALKSKLQKLYLCFMKKYFYFLLVLISCNNDLEINENWKDIPVIYGVLNPGSDENIDNISGSGRNYDHYVRVQKSFLGDGSALTYTQVSDSIYYDPDNIDVWLELLDSGTGESDGPFYLEYIS